MNLPDHILERERKELARPESWPIAGPIPNGSGNCVAFASMKKRTGSGSGLEGLTFGTLKCEFGPDVMEYAILEGHSLPEFVYMVRRGSIEGKDYNFKPIKGGVEALLEMGWISD